MKVYTRKGDDGTTGLLFGGRVAKDDSAPEAYGAVDEAVAALGVARALAENDLGARLLDLQRQLFVVGAELATDPTHRSKLTPGVSLVTDQMVETLEGWIDDLTERHGLATEFLVPGQDPVSAQLDVARAVVRRAERRTVHLHSRGGWEASATGRYLNRLADYLYMLVRATEAGRVPSKERTDG
jgi:cob(I)alamin adenosyltransferase